MSTGQIENSRPASLGDRNRSRRPVPTPSRCADDYSDVMRAQGRRATRMMEKLLAGEAIEPAPKPKPRPLPAPDKLPIPEVPEIADIARSFEERDEEFDALIARLEVMRVDDDPSKGYRIARAVAKAYSLSFRVLISNSRLKHIVMARHHAMWAMKNYTKLSMPQIGKILGNRDHTTVLHGIRRHQARIDAGEVANA